MAGQLIVRAQAPYPQIGSALGTDLPPVQIGPPSGTDLPVQIGPPQGTGPRRTGLPADPLGEAALVWQQAAASVAAAAVGARAQAWAVVAAAFVEAAACAAAVGALVGGGRISR